MIPKFYGQIDKGEFTLDYPERFKKYLISIQYKTKPVRVEIAVKRFRKKRSTSQKNLYWLWLIHIGNEIGEETENLHVTFKAMYLVDRTKKLPIIKSTMQLISKEFTDYLDKIGDRTENE